MSRIISQLFSWFGGPRSSRWSAVRARHIRDFPTCSACDKKDGLEVHHILPVCHYPQLELEESNLITLCETCHLVFGHLGDWKAHNPEVEQSAADHLERVRTYREETRDAHP